MEGVRGSEGRENNNCPVRLPKQQTITATLKAASEHLSEYVATVQVLKT
jgi:hypothetical protein